MSNNKKSKINTTTSTTSIESIPQLIDIITLLQNKKSTQKLSAIPTSNVGGTSQKEPIIENIQKEADKIRQKTKDLFSHFLDTQPLYKKPAYYLDQFSPYCRMFLVYFEREDPSKINSPVVEKQIAVIHEENFDINNFVKSVNISFLNDNQNGGVTIDLIDVQQDVADFLISQIALLQGASRTKEYQNQSIIQGAISSITYIKLQYGWYYNKLRSDITISDIKDVVFQNSIYISVNDIKVSFSSGGIPTITITGTYNLNFPGLYMYLSPFNVLGTFPILPLCLKEVYDILHDVMQYIIIPIITNKLTITKNKNRDIQLAILFLASILNVKYLKDKSVITTIIQSYFKYYNTVYSTLGLLAYVSLTSHIIKTDPIPPYNDKIFTKFRTILSNNNSGINKIITLLQENENFNYSMYFTKLLSDNKNNKSYYEYIGNLGAALLDNVKIHPYIAYKYMRKIFDQKIQEFKSLNAKPNIVTIILEMFQILENDILPLPNEWLYDINYIPTINDIEKYYMLANTTISYNDTSWYTLFNQCLQHIYVALPNTVMNKTLYGDTTQSIKVTINNKLTTVHYIPKNLCLAQIQCDKLGAKNNLMLLKKILLKRNELLNAQLATINSNLQSAKQKTQKKVNTTTTISNLQMQQNDLNTKIQFTNQLLKIIDSQQFIDDALYMIYILDFNYASDFLTPDILKTNIIQCYSHNINGIYEKDYNGYYNPGIPSCLFVNFPDVLEFNTEMNYYYSMLQLFQLKFITGERHINDLQIENINALKINEYLQKATDVYNNKQLSIEEKINQLNTILNDINNITGNDTDTTPLVNSLIPLEPLTINLRSFSDGRIYNGDLEHTLHYKKNLQELRKRILLSAIPAKATIRVIGDASLTMNDITNKYIFLKVTNIDGSLSPFTGLYLITDITHSISNIFTTELKLISAFQNTLDDSQMSVDRRNAFYKMIYSVDNQRILKRIK